MKKLFRLFTIFIVVLSTGLLNPSVQNLNYVTSTLVAGNICDSNQSANDIDSDDENFNVNLYEIECLIHVSNFIYSPKTFTIPFEENLPTLISSYMFSIFIPPLAIRVS